jgi:hypothetical protein
MGTAIAVARATTIIVPKMALAIPPPPNPGGGGNLVKRLAFKRPTPCTKTKPRTAKRGITVTAKHKAERTVIIVPNSDRGLLGFFLRLLPKFALSISVISGNYEL